MKENVNIERIYPRGRIVLREVGLRDGLQMVRSHPSTGQKRAWLAAEYRAGIRHFEVGSFVPAATFPQFADVDAMVDATHELPGAFASTLVLNKKGALRALDGQSDEVTLVISASEAHNLANAGRSQTVSMREMMESIALLRGKPARPIINVAIATAYGCSIAGKDSVTAADVLGIADACLDAGADVLTIADTVGYATPAEVGEMTRRVTAIAGRVPVAGHFHDTRGMAIANAAAALDHGCVILDASLGGLGGCPFAPNASGNAVMEDMAFLVRDLGLAHGLDIDLLLEARRVMHVAMPEETLFGSLARSGMPRLSAELGQL